MRNLEKFSGNVISKTEMKKVLGGIQCWITDMNGNDVLDRGPCASDNMNDCFSYISTAASNLSIQTGESFKFGCD